ncbi:4-coumarate--coa ligase-like 5 [Quercus suber]|uniref:4-coumarate--coa ligase-like 5 n=1 Tax=Quercus suber TaxID=58331 RepID=A0AAW0L1X5_QUESU
MSIGAVITTTNPLNTTREIGKQVADSKPILAFTTRQLVPKLAESTLPIVLLDEDEPSQQYVKSAKILTTLSEMLKKQPSERRVRTESTRTTRRHCSTLPAPPEPAKAWFICTVPMFHIYGLAVFAVALLASGTTVVILSKYEMHDMLSAIEKYRITYLPLVPPILVALVNGADQIRSKYDLSSLQSVLSGGAPLSKEVIEGYVERYPTVTILQGYGLTESTGVGASTDSLEESRRYGTAGLLSPDMEGKIVDPESVVV